MTFYSVSRQVLRGHSWKEAVAEGGERHCSDKLSARYQQQLLGTKYTLDRDCQPQQWTPPFQKGEVHSRLLGSLAIEWLSKLVLGCMGPWKSTVQSTLDAPPLTELFPCLGLWYLGIIGTHGCISPGAIHMILLKRHTFNHWTTEE